jgi:hypothetical protein
VLPDLRPLQSGTVLARSRPSRACRRGGRKRPALTLPPRGADARARSGQRNGAAIKQRNWLLMPRLTDCLSQLANVTVTIAAGENMPRQRIGAAPMTAAERQARRRARLRRDSHTPPAPSPRRPRRDPNAGPPRLRSWSTSKTNAVLGSTICRPTWKARGWPTSCTPLPNSTSMSCRQSSYPAATAATDTGGSPATPPAAMVKLLNLTHTTSKRRTLSSKATSRSLGTALGRYHLARRGRNGLKPS